MDTFDVLEVSGWTTYMPHYPLQVYGLYSCCSCMLSTTNYARTWWLPASHTPTLVYTMNKTSCSCMLSTTSDARTWWLPASRTPTLVLYEQDYNNPDWVHILFSPSNKNASQIRIIILVPMVSILERFHCTSLSGGHLGHWNVQHHCLKWHAPRER